MRCRSGAFLPTALALAFAFGTNALPAAAAQDPQAIAKIAALDARAPLPERALISQEILRSAVKFAAKRKWCMPTKVEIESTSPMTGVRNIIDGILANQIRNGWVVYVQQSGCAAQAELFRYGVVQRVDGGLVAFPINRGRTIASLSLVQDTGPPAGVAALRAIHAQDRPGKKCNDSDIDMVSMRVVSTSKDLGPDVFGVRYVGSWREMWRFVACAKHIDVPVDFTADGDGGADIHVDQREIAIVP